MQLKHQKLRLFFLLIVGTLLSQTTAQLDAFGPLNGQNYAPKPTITPDLVKYFELDGHARELVDMLTGPRPGGFFPEKTYEVATAARTHSTNPKGSNAAPNGLEAVGRAVEQFFSGPPDSNTNYQLPPGFSQGFSLNNGNSALTSFQQNSKPSSANVEEKASKSSISGIPNDFPKLPKFPFSAIGGGVDDAVIRRREPVVLENVPSVPKFSSKPDVPEGGLGLVENNVRRHPSSVSEVAYSGLSSTAADTSEYGTLTDEPHTPGGLIGTVLDLLGMNKEGKPADASTIGKAMTNFLGGNNSPIPGKSMINNVLYKALTSGSIQSNETDENSLLNFNSSKPITLTAAQQSAINENLEMIQNLISQPSGPLCNPKPVPVSEFNIDAFMGQWYQVVYSPPLTQSACSVVSYKKLSDINNGGIGSIFEVFEYTTDGMPYTKPKITSGYSIVKQAGELIFRTSAHQDDVNIHVIATGPINKDGEYDYTILTANCNYPVYVFARDPVYFKQVLFLLFFFDKLASLNYTFLQYEETVTQILEKQGIVNGFSKLLNIVSPVDTSTCTFPPTLFNVRG